MKKLLLAVSLFCLLTGCKKDAFDSSSSSTSCGTYKSGQQLYSGPEGGCYYYSSGGNKEYVERSFCKCSVK